ncbi:MAG TPA: DUF4382 domain-containing protein [Aquabacterium sp.]|nr:DUF4382 domain-containing protein [Aquabacterium sp.]
MLRRFGWILVCVASGLLAACGGGSGGSSTGSNLSNISKTGTFSLGFSGGSVPGIRHAWLTAYKIAFNEDANRPWDPTDTTWKVVTLSTPVTFDIASAGGFIVGSAAAGVVVPAGTYNQIRLFLSSYDDTASLPVVSDEAGATKTLTFKAQLDYDGGASVPIEIPNVNTGLRLDRGVVIEANNWSVLTVHLDVDRSIVRFDGGYGANDAITFRPRTFTHGVSTSAGVISGAIDPQYICGTSVALASCVSDIVVSAYAPTSDGTRMENWQTVRVTPKSLSSPSADDGTFVLGPFSSTGGNPSKFDVVIRGKGMKTMLFKDVTYGSSLFGTYLGCTWSTAANSSDPNAKTLIQPILDSGTLRTAALSPALALKTGRVGLGFSFSSGPVYETYNANTDPFTGLLTNAADLALPSTSGTDVFSIDFATGVTNQCSSLNPRSSSDLVIPNATITFTANAVANYQPFALSTFYTNAKLGSTLYSTSSGGTSFTVDEPTPVAVDTGAVSVSLQGFSALGAAGFDRAQLVVSDVGGIVQTLDVHDCLSGASPCTKTLNLPALTAATSANGAAAGVYEFGVRYWKAVDPQSQIAGGSMKWARSSAFVNLRLVSTGSVTITAP